MKRQAGATIMTVALTLLFLMTYMALALDFGHLFVVKTELQSAADACALAAAQELDGAPGAITRATEAGKAIGNLNNVNFQRAGVVFVDANVTFSSTLNGMYTRGEPVATAKYAKCIATKTSMTPWMMKAMAGYTVNPAYGGNPGNAVYGSSQSVQAVGVATRASGQNVCNALPIMISPGSATGPGTYFGYSRGDWIPSLYNENAAQALGNGRFGWANFDGSNNTNQTVAELVGGNNCSVVTTTGQTIGTPGAALGARAAWNSRFGIYRNGAGNPKLSDAPPDFTGFSYTLATRPAGGAINDYLAKRALNTPYQGPNIPGFNNVATQAQLAANGRSRRLAVSPIVQISGANRTVAGWACLLMVQPIAGNGPTATVYIEFVGNANAADSPCANNGLAGGSGGPLVPVLVQ